MKRSIALAAVCAMGLAAAAPAQLTDRNNQDFVLSGARLSATLSAPGATAWVAVRGDFNVTIAPTGGAFSCGLERSFDQGATAVAETLLDQPFTLAGSGTLSTTWNEPEAKVLTRVTCATVPTSLAVRISQ